METTMRRLACYRISIPRVRQISRRHIGLSVTQGRRFATPSESRTSNPNLAGADRRTPYWKDTHELNLDPNNNRTRINGSSLEIHTKANGFVPVSQTWLRDICSCRKCRNPDTAQRQINVFSDQVDCRVVKIESNEDNTTFQITFGDGHETNLTRGQLLGRNNATIDNMRRGAIPFQTWNASIATQPPTVQYQQIQSQGPQELLFKINNFGFCFVENAPPNSEDTESLLSSIGPIRNTHYGAFYDFTADLSSKDTAYTSESLEPHTDNTYFTEPAGLQALHLLSHTEGTGGESSLVDGFRAAQILFKENKQDYSMLSNTGVWAHASGNEGISIQPNMSYPVISHDNGLVISQVRWNNADRAGVGSSHRNLEKWYKAARRFNSIINDLGNQYWFQLTPGKILIFDNWRVLHGRAAFTGKRRMCGGYINRDDYVSKFRMTNMSEDEIRASTVTG